MRNINPSDKRVRVHATRIEPGLTEVQYVGHEAGLHGRSASITRVKDEEGWRLYCYVSAEAGTDGMKTAKGLKKAAAVAAAAAWVADGVQP